VFDARLQDRARSQTFSTLRPRVTPLKAVVLAGGVGKRLRPITNSIPKSLIPINGKPIIVHQIGWLKECGINELILCVGYLKEKLIEYLRDGEAFDIRVAYVIEDSPLGTGGALKNAEHFIEEGECFIALNGDVITHLSVSGLLDSLHKGAVGSIALVPLPSPYGIVEVSEDGYVRSFSEKPVIAEYWINAGIYAFTSDVFRYLPKVGDIERTTFPALAAERKLRAVKYSGIFWKGIDTHKDIEEAEAFFTSVEAAKTAPPSPAP